MKRWFPPAVLTLLFLVFSGSTFADNITFSGNVSTFDQNGITSCSNSATSSGSSASLNLNCALGDGQTQALVVGNAGRSSGFIRGEGDSAPQTGGVFAWTLALTENFTFKSAGIVYIQLNGDSGGTTDIPYSFTFDGTTITTDQVGYIDNYSFAVQPGTYSFELTASSGNSGTDGNSVLGDFSYSLTSNVPEPSSFVLLLPGVLMLGAKVRRSVRP